MAKKRKNLIKRITESRKFKRLIWGAFIFFALLCLGATISDKTFRGSVNIAGFETKYSEVSSKTRKALRTELDDFVLLNTGSNSKKVKFAIREDQELISEEDDDGNKYGAFLMDSDELQISARVQMYWSKGLSAPDASFIARIDCASQENSKYENSHCYSRSTGEAARAIMLDNLGLLGSYGASSEVVETMQGSMLDYLKIAYPAAASALVSRESVKNDGTELRAILMLDNGKEFELAVENKDDWSINLKSGENIVWETNSDRKVATYRHHSVLKQNLPVELETESHARFTLNYLNKNQLSINSVECSENTRNSELEQAAKDWLESNNFEVEAYEIKLKNSCKN